ncbi:MAG: hypothetical protein PHN89_04830 [Candidatus Pacebacteria bacterium]|nr:hypothetical protein [Candidatus Paceibacterota bacterium]
MQRKKMQKLFTKTFRLPKEMIEELKEQAEKEQVSEGSIVRKILKDHFFSQVDYPLKVE